jgi:predicted phosphoribosyltransferase
MTISQSFTVHNREHAGLLLAEKLRRFKASKTVVIGVSRTGALIGYHLASVLHLPFDVVLCKKINHPSNTYKSIGSISVSEVIIHEDARDIPREYIYRQIVLNQNTLKAQQALYKSNHAQSGVENKTVIIVGDILNSADSVLAGLRSIKKQKPEEIIVAAPAATPEVISRLLREADDVVVLAAENNVWKENFYEEYSLTSDEVIKELIVKAMKEFRQG